MVNKLEGFKNACIECLDAFSLMQLRTYGRSSGVDVPTKKKKGELIAGIVAVLAGEASNITAFRGLFKITRNDPSDALLKYIFRWNATREALPSLEAKSSLAKKVKEAALSGARFYESLGYIMK